MAEQNPTFKHIMDKLVQNSINKKEFLTSLLIQTTDLLRSYEIDEFESNCINISNLIKEQFDLIELIRNRNTARIHITLTNQQIVNFFKLFVKFLNTFGNQFPIKQRQLLDELLRELHKYSEAKLNNHHAIAAQASQKIKENFPIFLKTEFEIGKIESSSREIYRLNQEQMNIFNQITHPKEIFRVLRERGINKKTLKALPEEFNSTVKSNKERIELLITMSNEEIEKCYNLNQLLTISFNKTNIVNSIVRRTETVPV